MLENWELLRKQPLNLNLAALSRVAIDLIFGCLLKKPNKPKKAKRVKALSLAFAAPSAAVAASEHALCLGGSTTRHQAVGA